MGGQCPKAAKPGSELLRRAGENLNTKNLPAVHTEIVLPPTNKAKKFSVCRCWKSTKFPFCDNLHQRLQKQGINVGPAMLEIQRGLPLTPVSAFRRCEDWEEPLLRVQTVKNSRDYTAPVALVGGLAASVIGGGAHFIGLV
ncbi:PfMNL-2 CISD1 family iron-sulfur protein [Cystoisospora suis]|uniref:PfMNL-2 CISD1 family iron-sulfur protein n=1 Tax=Cystoisospora suis TaxID=483139 RepID=A0A2C6KF62_9APIC|nr:PfMNL-2 CISD1 family iron-sulfur protein [Cystoisospora suis]